MVITSELCESIGLQSSQNMIERKPAWVAGNISKLDQPLLIGLTKLLKPKKVVEIGVASGWSGCLFIDALSQNGTPAEYIGIDLSENYYLDSNRATGSAISEVVMDNDIKKRLLLGLHAVDCVNDIGGNVDLAFIDGDHRHPWATLDFLSLIPTLSSNAYILIHDLNLSTYPRHDQTNRGPKYLFESWPYEKIHSSQNLPMIGAVKMPTTIDEQFLSLILNTTYTPWETTIEKSLLEKVSNNIGLRFGNEWKEKFSEAFYKMNTGSGSQQGDSERKEFIEQVIHLVSRNPRSSLHLSMLLSVIAIYPASARLHHHLSILKLRHNDIEGAIESSLRAVELANSNAHFISFLGELYCSAGELSKAETCLTNAINLQENVAIFHYRLAHLFEKTERLSEAISAAHRARELASSNADFDNYFRTLIRQ